MAELFRLVNNSSLLSRIVVFFSDLEGFSVATDLSIFSLGSDRPRIPNIYINHGKTMGKWWLNGILWDLPSGRRLRNIWTITLSNGKTHCFYGHFQWQCNKLPEGHPQKIHSDIWKEWQQPWPRVLNMSQRESEEGQKPRATAQEWFGFKILEFMKGTYGIFKQFDPQIFQCVGCILSYFCFTEIMLLLLAASLLDAPTSNTHRQYKTSSHLAVAMALKLIDQKENGWRCIWFDRKPFAYFTWLWKITSLIRLTIGKSSI